MVNTDRMEKDDQRWNAVLSRSTEEDGRFVYAVKTTGVYCRPSCRARRALRKNVQFFATCAEAEAEGFRECKKCQPNGRSLEQEQAARIARVCVKIECSEEPLALAELARSAGMSTFHFQRVFKRITGFTPKAYIKSQRDERMRKELARGTQVTETIYAAGFGSSGRFYAEAPKALGMLPKKYRRGGEGEVIQFAVGECSLGAILVAASEKGVCAISLGQEPQRLVEELQKQFHAAKLVGGDKAFEKLVAQVVGFIEAPEVGLELPLDLRGTIFQQRVWKALQTIPPGSRLTYSELAELVGTPEAVRAVAGACAANKIAVAIPCHRVVRRNGELSGYRWGVERKRALLLREHRAGADKGAKKKGVFAN